MKLNLSISEGKINTFELSTQSLNSEIEQLKNDLLRTKDAKNGLDNTKYSQEKSITELMLKN